MNSDVLDQCKKLSKAVEIVLDPNVDNKQRAEAYTFVEEFKESSPICGSCGMRLASKENPHIVRHLGLQLIEHCIRFRWNTLIPQDRLNIKKYAMIFISKGTFDILTEESHIKDALSRIVVEIIKREWPQCWPELMDELHELCQMGETQTELVLLIFLRLAEDVVAFQAVQTQRRREIYQSLNTNMHGFFNFFIIQLDQSVKYYRSLLEYDEVQGKRKKSMAHCRIAQSVLMTLSGFVEWVSISDLMMKDGILLQLLCLLLADRNLQLHAAECLLQIVSRKGKASDRVPLLLLFNDNLMETILNAVSLAASASLEEHHYVFLKKLCQVLCGMGNQLCTLLGTTDEVKCPSTFSKYIQCMISFADHPSQMINRNVHFLWGSIFRHEHLCKHVDVLAALPKIVSCAAAKLVKVGFPSHSDSVSCDYSRLDFDSDEEFCAFNCVLKSEVTETIRLATVLSPMTTFQYAVYWLENQLKQNVQSEAADSDNWMCTISSMRYLQWEAMSVFLECVTSKVFHSPNEPKPKIEDGITLLKAVIQYDTQDPLILSCVLSCISALFIFLPDESEMLPKVVDKIFSALIFSLPGQTKGTRSRAVKNVRRHACSSLVKICKLYPTRLMPCFQQICVLFSNLCQDPEQLSQMEKCTLIEALILISNQFKDFNKQSAFIEDILKRVMPTWMADNMKNAFSSGSSIMTFIGLDKEPVEPSNSDTVGLNRSHIILCVDMMLAVVKRSTWPSDIEEAKNGGFVEVAADGSHILRNPAGRHMFLLLENVFHLLRVFNELWQPQVVSQVCPQFKKAYEMLEANRNNILGIPTTVSVDALKNSKSPIDRMQSFLTFVPDNCCHLLGNSGPSLGHDFYSIPNLSNMVNDNIFANLDNIPDYRLRPIIRVFLKPFVQYCPAELYPTVVIPVLSHICPYMLQRLNTKWQQVNQFDSEILMECENPESQEVVDDQLNRQMTKEYIDVLAIAILKKGRNVEDTGDQQMESDEMVYHKVSQHDDALSDLGLLIVHSSEVLLSSLVSCVFNALSWNDTIACSKCSHLCWPIVKQLLQEDMIKSAEACHIIERILEGLQKHGQHEANQSKLINLCLQLYEAFRPKFPEVSQLLSKIPNCKKSDIQYLDEKILQEVPSKQFLEKKKRDVFKRIIVEIIGQNIGQMFKKESKIMNLPKLFTAPRSKNKDVIESEKDNVGLCMLFKRPTNKL